MVVPLAVAIPGANPAGPPKISMRTRRLRADADAMEQAFADFPVIEVKPVAGEPPEIYHIQYQIKSLAPGVDGKPVTAGLHRAEIQLTSDYPRISPKCRMLTPIFHPNIDAASICVGDHWTAGERLADLVIRIGEMIAYQAYNVRSPLNAEAAMWADLNSATLPLDTQDLRPPGME